MEDFVGAQSPEPFDDPAPPPPRARRAAPPPPPPQPPPQAEMDAILGPPPGLCSLSATAIQKAAITRPVDREHRAPMPRPDGVEVDDDDVDFNIGCLFCGRSDFNAQCTKAQIINDAINNVCSSIDSIVYCAWAGLVARDADCPETNGKRPPHINLETIFRCTSEHNRHPAVVRAILIHNSTVFGNGILAGLREATLRDGGPMYRKGGVGEYLAWQKAHLELLKSDPSQMNDYDKLPKITDTLNPLRIASSYK
jgi:hypothetical protein